MNVIIKQQAANYLADICRGKEPDLQTVGFYFSDIETLWIGFRGDFEIKSFSNEYNARLFAQGVID